MIKKRPPRLYRIFPDAPLYFVTFCTRDRKALTQLPKVNAAFHSYAQRAAEEFNVAVGCYVIMPDHVHLFVRGGIEFDLSKWIAGLKRALSVAANDKPGGTPVWQPGVFDHVLRSDESYAEKWNYVRANSVRAGLVARSEDWPHQGEIVVIDRA